MLRNNNKSQITCLKLLPRISFIIIRNLYEILRDKFTIEYLTNPWFTLIVGIIYFLALRGTVVYAEESFFRSMAWKLLSNDMPVEQSEHEKDNSLSEYIPYRGPVVTLTASLLNLDLTIDPNQTETESSYDNEIDNVSETNSDNNNDFAVNGLQAHFDFYKEKVQCYVNSAHYINRDIS